VIPEEVLARIQILIETSNPVLVAVAGAVAVGKSTFAAELATRCDGVVVSTDGFLLPNDTLDERGLAQQKGFPESFDVDALRWFLETVRNDETIDGLPRYSHDTFDVERSPEPFVRRPVVIIEGVNALQSNIAELVDLRIFLDAAEEDVIGWYTTRFERFTEDARQTGEGFYTRFADQTKDQLAGTARYVWDLINSPNLHQHIAPTKVNADIVLTKAANHTIR
jgi:type I pantothenate kinase